MPVSQTDDWATPQALFDQLDEIHNFTLDVAAAPFPSILVEF
jgi:hypothetical protein